MKNKELKVRVFVRKGSETPILWDNLSKEQQESIGKKLNDIALRSIGYIPIEKE